MGQIQGSTETGFESRLVSDEEVGNTLNMLVGNLARGSSFLNASKKAEGELEDGGK